MDQPETWRWIWLVAAAVFAVGEMTAAGSFFLLPFAAGAVVAAVLAFLGVAVGFEWLTFVGVSAGIFVALRPLARRFDRDQPTEGIGAKRLIGQSAIVLEAIPGGGHDHGLVRVNREEWRAETVDGSAVDAGATVRVVEQRGTRLIVHATPSPDAIEPAKES